MTYYATYPYKHWTFILAATEKGLSRLCLKEDIHEKDALMTYNDEFMLPYKKLLDAYFSGIHPQDFLMDVEGTQFQKDVWYYLKTIPYGTVSSYQDVAKGINRPTAFRAVGGAVGKNPIMLLIPCHRVIKSDHSIGGFSSDPNLKIDLLTFERKNINR